LTKYYYLGPWVWRDDPETGPAWIAPAGTLGLFDMRAISPSEAYGFFCTTEPLDSSYIALNDGTDFREYHTTQAQRDAWRSALGLKLSELPDSITLLRDIVVKIFEELGDPEGGERFLPPTCTHRGNLEFWLGGHSLISRRKFQGENDPAWPRIQALLHRQYRNLADHGIEARKRLLWNWKRKYRVDDDLAFQPPGLRERAERPQTSGSDGFSGSGNLDGSTTDSGEGWTWSQFYNYSNVPIRNGYAVGQGASNKRGELRADCVLSSDDHYSQFLYIESPTPGNFCGCSTRKDSSSARTHYAVLCVAGFTSLVRYLIGISKTLGTGSEVGAADIVKLQSDGSTHKIFKNGGEIVSVTDTDISGNLYTGALFAGTKSLDNFQAADLGGDLGGFPSPQLFGQTFGQNAFQG